ncbi:hypothetical protein [Clostridium sp. DL1XJH146]
MVSNLGKKLEEEFKNREEKGVKEGMLSSLIQDVQIKDKKEKRK